MCLGLPARCRGRRVTPSYEQAHTHDPNYKSVQKLFMCGPTLQGYTHDDVLTFTVKNRRRLHADASRLHL